MADQDQIRQLVGKSLGTFGAAPQTGGPAGAPAGGSLSSPSPQMGNQVKAMAKVRNALKLLEEALPDLGAETEVGSAIITSIKALASKAQETKSTAGADSTVLRDLAQKAMQQAPQTALNRVTGPQGGMPNG